MQLHILCEDIRDHTTQEVVLEPEASIVLGRDRSSPLLLEHEAISREHVLLSREGNQLTLADVSTNGAQLNSSPMPERKPVPIRGGDILEIPGYRLVLTLLAQAQPAGPITPSSGRTAFLSPILKFWRSFRPAERLSLVAALLALILFGVYVLN